MIQLNYQVDRFQMWPHNVSVMETRSNHNHNQAEYHPGVDRLPCGVIFSITTPIMGKAQRLDVVGARSLLESSLPPTSKEGPADAYSDGAS